MDHSTIAGGVIHPLKSEVRYVNGNFIDHCCGVVVTRWWGLGILSLAEVGLTREKVS